MQWYGKELGTLWSALNIIYVNYNLYSSIIVLSIFFYNRIRLNEARIIFWLKNIQVMFMFIVRYFSLNISYSRQCENRKNKYLKIFYKNQIAEIQHLKKYKFKLYTKCFFMLKILAKPKLIYCTFKVNHLSAIMKK